MADIEGQSQTYPGDSQSWDKKLDKILDELARIDSKLETLKYQVEESDRVSRKYLQEVRKVLKTGRDSLPSEISELLALRMHIVGIENSMPALGGWPLGAPTTVDICRKIESGNIIGNILELGGGASTVWIAETLKRMDFQGQFWSVDHDKEFLAKTEELLNSRGVAKFVHLINAPITPTTLIGDSRRWYGFKRSQEFHNIGLLIVDGPPGTTNVEARLPSLYYIADRLVDGAWIYLDDYNRPDEKKIAASWLKDFPQLIQQTQIGDTRIFQFNKSSKDIQSP